MRTRIVLLMVVVVLGSGCAALQDQSPEQKFKSQLQDATTSKYHVEYDIEADMGGIGGMISGAVDSPELYSTEERSKFVVGFSGMTAAVYNVFGENTAYCTEGSFLGLDNSSNGPECKKTPDTEIKTEWMENVSIKEAGTETVASRECNLYTLEEAENFSSSEIPDKAEQYSEGNFKICLDKEKGYPALISLKMNRTSELRSSDSEQSIDIKAESHDTEFDEMDLIVPVSAITTLSCDPFQANVTSFGYEGSADVTVNGQEETTITMETGDTETVELSEANKEDGTNEIEVDTGRNTYTSECSSYSFGSDLGGLGGDNEDEFGLDAEEDTGIDQNHTFE